MHQSMWLEDRNDICGFESRVGAGFLCKAAGYKTGNLEGHLWLLEAKSRKRVVQPVTVAGMPQNRRSLRRVK
jgi:hypothetical protein